LALKREAAREWPLWRFAYSRRGFVTFKLPDAHDLQDDFEPGLVFARICGYSLGAAEGADDVERAASVWQIWGDQCTAVHVWARDGALPRIELPRLAEWTNQVVDKLRQTAPISQSHSARSFNEKVPPATHVLDVILLSPNDWWVGTHCTRSGPERWPGGILPLELPPAAASRAWLKMEEALSFADLPLRAGDQVAEIGCSPGGTTQALLSRGLIVTGIDPAEVTPTVLAHPHFTHVRKRGADVRLRDFRSVRWLTADLNVPPRMTLATVERIVTHREANVRGLIIMLKLPDWKLADEVSDWLERIRSWGYADVRARHLMHNRQEVCVVARRRHRLTRKKRGADTGRTKSSAYN
jgi:23S rRNA (cytidine2498-2'-O)-methyltransferase